jgi:hypothetical protein
MKRFLFLLAVAMLSLTSSAFAGTAAPLDELLAAIETPATCSPAEPTPSLGETAEVQPLPVFQPEPLPKTHPCHADCTTEFQRLCRQQGGYCTLHPDFGFCGCYYP